MHLLDRRKFSRRAILKGLAGGAVAAPFLPYLSSEAEAESTPTRLLLLLTSEAPIYGRWIPTPRSETDGRIDTTEFDFNETSAPLEPHREQVVVVGGVNKRPGRTSSNGAQHDQAFSHAWTGQELSAGSLRTSNGSEAGWGKGISVDQYIAETLEPGTRFPTLELGVVCQRHDPGTRSIYSGPNEPIQPRTNPYDVFDLLFAGDTESSEELKRIRAERRSVIDRVQDNLRSVRRRVSNEDRIKLDAHLTHVRSIEERLQGDGAVCERPSDLGDPIDHRDGQDANVPTLYDLQMDLAVLALSCDVTRIVSLQVGRALSGYSPVWLDIHDSAHAIGHYDWRTTDESLVKRDKCARLDHWRHEKFARLLSKMDEHGLLPSSLVVWNQELGQTNSHNMNPTPFVLAGQANGRLRTGRYVEYGDRDTQAQMRCEGDWPQSTCIGEPHPKLLVDMCHVMGPDVPGLGDIETFGDTSFYNGRGGLPDLFDV